MGDRILSLYKHPEPLLNFDQFFFQDRRGHVFVHSREFVLKADVGHGGLAELERLSNRGVALVDHPILSGFNIPEAHGADFFDYIGLHLIEDLFLIIVVHDIRGGASL